MSWLVTLTARCIDAALEAAQRAVEGVAACIEHSRSLYREHEA